MVYGVPVPPRDRTLVKSNADTTVYLVKNGKLSALSAAQFKAGRYSFTKIVALPQSEVDSYVKANAVSQ